jgi:hypothetical protein
MLLCCVKGAKCGVVACTVDSLESEFSGQFASGGSNASVMITTVFDDGPWVDICDFLGISTVPGRLYGNVDLRIKNSSTVIA